jgi:hypothetical protein
VISIGTQPTLKSMAVHGLPSKATKETSNPIPLNNATARKSLENKFVISFLLNSLCGNVLLSNGMAYSCDPRRLACCSPFNPIGRYFSVRAALLRRQISRLCRENAESLSRAVARIA